MRTRRRAICGAVPCRWRGARSAAILANLPLIARVGETTNITRRSEAVPMMTDLDRRFEVMDMFGPDYQQILSLASPPFEKYADPATALELARIGSDSMAELCQEYPDRFPGFIGTAVLSSPDAMVEEARRNIEDLGACGMQIFTNVSGKPLDLPECEPFFDYMGKIRESGLDAPGAWRELPRLFDRGPVGIRDLVDARLALRDLGGHGAHGLLRPVRPASGPEGHHPPRGRHDPVLRGTSRSRRDQMGARTTDRDLAAVRKALKRPHLEYFKDFYADTASFGSRKAIEHAIEFFGEDHVMFASNAPFDPEKGGPVSQRARLRRGRCRAFASALWRLRDQHRLRGCPQSGLEACRAAAGLGGEALLDSYDLERRPVFGSTADDFIAGFIEEDRTFLERYSPEKDRAECEETWFSRNEGAVEVAAVDSHYDGSRVVPMTLENGDNVYEWLGPGFTFTAFDAEPAAAEPIRHKADALGVPLAEVGQAEAGP